VGVEAAISLLKAAIRLATPTALAAIGETVSQRAGVLNLGLEGMMIAGALGSFVSAYYLSDVVWIALVVGALAGVLLAVIKAFLSITLKTEQIVNGIAVVLLAQGVAALIYARVVEGASSPPRIEGAPEVTIPLLSRIPFVGEVLFDQNVLVYLAALIFAGVWILLTRTRFGLAVNVVGENPQAADALGVSVDGIRWAALTLSGAVAGLGGAILVLGQLRLYANNMTAGRGWIAIAIVLLSRWRPQWVLAGSLIFGLTDALQLRLQAGSGGLEGRLPFEIFQALPYVVTLVVVAATRVATRRGDQPAALGQAYRRSEVG
jgi:ABC-type uncharacterized transport system permease subunit